MRITSIRESGSPNTLRWAIQNNAELKDNLALSSIINDDLFYLVTIENVNLYELFRLTQLYRNKIRIAKINRATIPADDVLSEIFAAYGSQAKAVLETGTSLVTQMLADNDIIPEGIAHLFLPMITTTFTIQIPFAFMDVIEAITDDEAKKIYGTDYSPNFEIIPPSLTRAIMISLERNTANLRYDKKYEQLLKMTKYHVLPTTTDKLHSVGLLSFARFNPMTRGEAKCSFFKPDKTVFHETLKQIAKLKTPLEMTFVIQLPIYHMQILESMYFPENLGISHRSSISNILENGMEFDNFNLSDGGGSEVAIGNYKIRIAESNLKLMQLITDMTNSKELIHPPSMFAMIPSIYRTNAVIRLMAEEIPEFINTSTDPVLLDMFKRIQHLTTAVTNDLQKV